ncbi:MAG: EAL domain-containing protein [Alphaproteobacteria bacterium]|nr:EAL domain-containing protein [Alphaproteobacteria bacterium]
MNKYDKEILRRIENLINSFQALIRDTDDEEPEEALVYGMRALVCLANMSMQGRDVFAVEPWHALCDDVPHDVPGEMLLRLVDYKEQPLAPYPAIMSFYDNGYTAAVDCILFLSALEQFTRSDWGQVSVNISARSLRDPDFVRATLSRLETLEIAGERKVIMEIHESMPHLAMSRQVLELYRALGVGFAIDDVGLNINDALRMGEFEGIAEYIKIDRRAVNAPMGASNALPKVMGFIRSLVPGAVVIAEGVKTAEQSVYIYETYPDIQYVQGLYLPDTLEAFQTEYSRALTQASHTRHR